MLRTAAIIGDVHGQDVRLEAVLNFIRAQVSVDAILCTGDSPTKEQGSLAHSAQLLEADNAFIIRGNHDRWRIQNASAYHAAFPTVEQEAEALPYLRSLPPIMEFQTPLGLLQLCHGVDRDNMAGTYPGGADNAIERALDTYGVSDRYRYMVCGHTYYRPVRTLFHGALTVINAGTLLLDKKPPAFAIADFERQQLWWFDVDLYSNEITPGAQQPL